MSKSLSELFDSMQNDKVELEAYNNGVRIKALGMDLALQYFYRNYVKELQDKETYKDKMAYTLYTLHILKETKKYINPDAKDRELFNEYIKKIVENLKQ